MSYSLSEIFRKDITRDEFVEKFTEMKTPSHEMSIFGTSSGNMPIGDQIETNTEDGETSFEQDLPAEAPSSSAAESAPNSEHTKNSVRAVAVRLFDKMDANHNQVFDEEEISTAAGYHNDGMNTDMEVSEHDLNILYDKLLEDGIKIGKPDKMYEDALKAETEKLKSEGYSEEDARLLAHYTSPYILELDNEMFLLAGIIDLTKSNFESLSKSYESQIKKSQNEQKEIEKDIAAKQKEIDDLKGKIKFLDSESDAEEIDAKQTQIDKKTNDIKGLNTKLTKIKSSVSDLETKLKDENTAVENKIKQYETRYNSLESAKSYAVTQVSSNDELGNTVSVDSSRYHQNDSLTSFDELTAMGYEYDSETGSALGEYVYSHQVGFTGKCAKKANDANIAVGVLDESDRRGAAYEMADVLAADDNFIEIKVSSAEELKNLPAGCELVYAQGAAGYSSEYGHIEITVGDGTAVSDGMTTNLRYSDDLRVFVPVKKTDEQTA